MVEVMKVVGRLVSDVELRGARRNIASCRGPLQAARHPIRPLPLQLRSCPDRVRLRPGQPCVCNEIDRETRSLLQRHAAKSHQQQQETKHTSTR